MRARVEDPLVLSDAIKTRPITRPKRVHRHEPWLVGDQRNERRAGGKSL
jgi:hypothetical protein